MRSADPYETSAPDALASFAFELKSAEAAVFPGALAGVLPLLHGDLDRTRFAVELASLLDLWEIAGEVAEIAVSRRDPDLILAASSLCGTAGLNGARADRLLGALSGAPELRRAAEIRLRPEAQPQTADEHLLFLQRWPGFRTRGDQSPAAPVVVLDSALDAAEMLTLAIELLRAGASVRRLPPTNPPNWFGPDTVLVCAARTRTRVLSAYPGFQESHLFTAPQLGSDQGVAVLLRRINAVLPSQRRLRLGELRTELATSVWDPDVYGLGVYETREASFLTAAPTSAMYRLAKQGLLEPRCFGVYMWAFRDLVALRTWHYLKSQSAKRISSGIIPLLARFSGDTKVVRLGATSDGHVLADRGSGWEDIVSGAQVMDLPVEDVDDAFRPFSLGGRRAPDLLAASQHTRLHPAILHGAPYRRGYRITAASLASLEKRNGYAAITAAYPQLEGVDVSDTVEVGRQLLAVT
jgi:hypothetical protein